MSHLPLPPPPAQIGYQLIATPTDSFPEGPQTPYLPHIWEIVLAYFFDTHPRKDFFGCGGWLNNVKRILKDLPEGCSDVDDCA
jgi:hypothetical protein